MQTAVRHLGDLFVKEQNSFNSSSAWKHVSPHACIAFLCYALFTANMVKHLHPKNDD